MRLNQKGSVLTTVLCVFAVTIILGLSMAAISTNSRSATAKYHHNQQAYYTARSALDGIATTLAQSGDAQAIATALADKKIANKTLTAKGTIGDMGDYDIIMELAQDVTYTTIQQPKLDADGKPEIDDEGKVILIDVQVVEKLPLKITARSDYKGSQAMVSLYMEGAPVYGEATGGGGNLPPPVKPEVGVDPQIAGLFPFVIGMQGTIGQMNNQVAIQGDICALGSIGYINKGATVTGDIYHGGGFSGKNDGIHAGTSHQLTPDQVDTNPAVPKLTHWNPPNEQPLTNLPNRTIDASQTPLYFTYDASGEITIGSLTITGTHPVYIRVPNATSITFAESISNEGNPNVFWICEKADEVDIGEDKSSGQSFFRGYVYAPNAEFEVEKNMNVFGALSGRIMDDLEHVDITYVPITNIGGTNPPSGTNPPGGGSGNPDDNEPVIPDFGDELKSCRWQVTRYEGGLTNG